MDSERQRTFHFSANTTKQTTFCTRHTALTGNGKGAIGFFGWSGEDWRSLGWRWVRAASACYAFLALPSLSVSFARREQREERGWEF